MQDITKVLTQCPLFIGVDSQVIEETLQNIHYQVKKYTNGQLVVSGGEQVDRLYIVLEGRVKGEMMDFSGKTIKIEDIDPPRPLAIAFMFGKKNTFPVNIIATEDSSMLVIQKQYVLKIFQQNEQILLNFLNAISNRSQFLSLKIRFLTFQTIRGKMANYILQLANGKQTEVTLPISQNEIAELFGVTRPSVGRSIRELHNDGVIEAKGKNIKILDMKALKESLQ